MTSYEILNPPFSPDFLGAPKEELRRFRSWFLGVIPQRIKELERAVRETPGFEAWRADETPESLVSLGRWFATQVATRPITKEEVDAIRKRSPYPIEMPTTELTHLTLSLATDIGMYFSRVLMRNLPGLHWDQDLTDKRNAHYGRLVVVGSGRVPLNPVAIAITLAYGVASKSKTGERLADLYPIWVHALHPDA